VTDVQVECAASHGAEAASTIIRILSSPVPVPAVIAAAASLKARGFSTGARNHFVVIVFRIVSSFAAAILTNNWLGCFDFSAIAQHFDAVIECALL
jgi:hypothetical protein